jgi:hypothetical protein
MAALLLIHASRLLVGAVAVGNAALSLWALGAHLRGRRTPGAGFWAVLLVVGGQLLSLLFREWGLETLAAGGSLGAASAWERSVSFLGAGLYEELVFRLALLPLCFSLLRGLLAPRGVAVVLAVVLSSAGLLPGPLRRWFRGVLARPDGWEVRELRAGTGIAWVARPGAAAPVGG